MSARTIKNWLDRGGNPTPRQISVLLRKCLEQGAQVEIDGLGVFHRKLGGEFQFTPHVQPTVFVAYVEEDLSAAEKLCFALRQYGINPWLDRERLLSGQNWPRRIENAIELSDCFLALFSHRSAYKRGQFQSELRYALDCAARLPLDDSFIVPVRLEECCVPQKLRRAIQYVDMFPDWDAGVTRLARAIRDSKTPPETASQ